MALTKLEVARGLKRRMSKLYEKKVNELMNLKSMPDGSVKSSLIELKANEMLGIAECLNIVGEFERYNWRDLND